MCSRAVIVSVLLLLLVPLSIFAAPPEGLVLYLPFDGDANDASGSENHPEIIGNESYVDGKFGQAMEFDGATYLEVQDNTAETFDGVSGFTVEVWVRQSTHHDNGIVVKLTTAGQWWPCSYNLETWSDQLAYFGVNTGAAGYATSPYPLDEWFHFVGLFDNGNVHTYINGEIGNSIVDPGDTVADGELPVCIGCVGPGAMLFIGELDEVAIYNRALTIEEIEADMESGISLAVESEGKLATTWAAVKAPG